MGGVCPSPRVTIKPVKVKKCCKCGGVGWVKLVTHAPTVALGARAPELTG
jgi:hypothetical protein